MADQRSSAQKIAWDRIGPPLYYCADCMLAVKIDVCEGQDPIITRPCGAECGHGIIAPRKSILAGEGGLSMTNKARMLLWKIEAALTGRCV